MFLIGALGCPRELFNDLDLGVEADIGVLNNTFDLAHHRRPQQEEARFDARAMHALDVLDSGICERAETRTDQGSCDLTITKRHLCDAGDGHSTRSQTLNEYTSIVLNLVEVNLQPRSGH